MKVNDEIEARRDLKGVRKGTKGKIKAVRFIRGVDGHPLAVVKWVGKGKLFVQEQRDLKYPDRDEVKEHLIPKDEDIDHFVQRYMDDQEGLGEPDGNLVGMSVNIDQVREVLLDFANYIKAL